MAVQLQAMVGSVLCDYFITTSAASLVIWQMAILSQGYSSIYDCSASRPHGLHLSASGSVRINATYNYRCINTRHITDGAIMRHLIRHKENKWFLIGPAGAMCNVAGGKVTAKVPGGCLRLESQRLTTCDWWYWPFYTEFFCGPPLCMCASTKMYPSASIEGQICLCL